MAVKAFVGVPIRYGDGTVEFNTQPWRQQEEDEEDSMNARYEVTVPGIGTVIRTNDKKQAENKFDYYKQGASPMHQFDDEPVVLWCDGEPIKEHTPKPQRRRDGKGRFIKG